MEYHTVKDVKVALKAMKGIYEYSDEKTRINIGGMNCAMLQIGTTDADTGIYIEMTKNLLERNHEEGR